MAIRALPTLSEPIYLRDLSEEVKQLEGEDCPKEEQAWVIVRQATEADNQNRSGLVSQRKVEWTDEGRIEQWEDNPLETYAMEVYSCLVDTGNILGSEDKPLLKFKKGPNYSELDMSFSQFRKAYGQLPLPVTRTMRQAVLTLNPDWDWVKRMAKEGE